MSDDVPAEDLPSTDHQTPAGVSDATVGAVGALTEALETAERARGALYDFHQLTGSADIKLGEAVQKLRDAGHDALADRLDAELVGANVLAGRWTFQIIEEYDDGYYALFRDLEKTARDQLTGGRRHLFEARLKESERSAGRPGHEATPDDV